MIKLLLRFFLLGIGVVSIVFLLVRLIPGDPVDILLGDMATDSAKQELRQELLLDKSLGEQYQIFMTRLIHFDLGTSIIKRRPNLELIAERIPATIELGLMSILFCVLLAIPFGVLSAKKQGKFFDKFFLSMSLFGMSIPNFWSAPVLILLFSVTLHMFPVSEKEGISSYVLPVITSSLGLLSILYRVVRTSSLEHFHHDYVRTAFAKGLSPQTILFKHVLKNALIPIVTVISLQLGAVLSGLVITETIFDWPGLGLLTYESIRNRDYPLLQACVITVTLIYLFVNVVTDYVYTLINPKLR